MEEPLQYDPRTKQQIKDAIYNFVYGPLLRHYQKRLEDIVAKNCVLTGIADQCFTYRGEVYVAQDMDTPRKLNRLHKSLIAIMEDYLKDLRQLNNHELPYVLGFIGQVLNSSNNLHDYLQILPSSVHSPIHELIASCPCRSMQLTPEKVQELKQKNQVSIGLMKQRMFTNLLI